MQPVYEKRRAVVKAIQKFWPVALMNHEMFALHCQHNLDQVALAYLEDLWVVRDPKEFRAFTIEFVSSAVAHIRRMYGRLTGGALRAALQGEPVLLEHGAQEGVQVRAA